MRVLLIAERARCPRADRHTPLPGGFGHRPTGITTGPRGAALDCRPGKAGNARHCRRPRKRGLESSRGLEASDESRGGAPRGERARWTRGRARSAEDGASASDERTRDGCAYRRSASLVCEGAFRCSGIAKLGRHSHRENDFAYPPPQRGGRGTTRSVVEGASEMTLRCRCRK